MLPPTGRLPPIIDASVGSFEDNQDLIEDGKAYDPNWAAHRLDYDHSQAVGPRVHPYDHV